ncbi:hypothetical protein I7I51_07310, partial [Histoplasma capsulatum]
EEEEETEILDPLNWIFIKERMRENETDPSPRLSTRAMNKTGHSDDNSSGQTSTQRTEPMMASTSGAGGPTSSRGPMAE